MPLDLVLQIFVFKSSKFDVSDNLWQVLFPCVVYLAFDIFRCKAKVSTKVLLLIIIIIILLLLLTYITFIIIFNHSKTPVSEYRHQATSHGLRGLDFRFNQSY